MKLVGLLVGLVVLCGVASPTFAQGQTPPAQGRPMTGALDVRPGMVNGQVQVGRGIAALNAKLTDRGPDGTLTFTAPGTFASTATVGNGALETNTTVCVAGREMTLQWTRGNGLHWQLDDASADPNACTLPSSADDGQLTMAPIVFAAQQAPATSDALQENLLDLGQRLVVLLVLSGILFLFAPGLSSSLTAAARSRPWSRLGLGLSTLIVMPVVAIALFVAGLGAGFWWFGLMLLALYGCLLPMGLAMAGMVVGVALLERIRQPFTPIAAPVIAGIVLLAVLGQVPAIGALVNVLALIYGLGALMLAPRQRTPVPVQIAPVPALAATAAVPAWAPSEAVTPTAATEAVKPAAASEAVTPAAAQDPTPLSS